jgi:hypothetical protein
VPGNDSTPPTTVGPDENCVKSKTLGKKAQTVCEPLRIRKLSGWSEAVCQQMAEGEPNESGDLRAGVNG